MAPVENDKTYYLRMVSKCGVGGKEIWDYVSTIEKREKENQYKICFYKFRMKTFLDYV